MGYTHYWNRRIDLAPKDAFGKLAIDAKRIIEAASDRGIEVAYEARGEGEERREASVITEGMIHLNGPDDRQGHETFVWPADPVADLQYWSRQAAAPGWSAYLREQLANVEVTREAHEFCKTARKPYDLVVCAILIRAKAHYGEGLEVTSDGRWEHEWSRGGHGWRSFESLDGTTHPGGPGGYVEEGEGGRRWPGLSAAGLCRELFGEAEDPLGKRVRV